MNGPGPRSYGLNSVRPEATGFPPRVNGAAAIIACIPSAEGHQDRKTGQTGQQPECPGETLPQRS
jgi:hypothetical protein